MVHEWPIRNYTYIKRNHTPYKSPFTEEEMQCIINTYDRQFVNESVVRLDGLSGMGTTTKVHLSLVHFNDFLVTNNLYATSLKIINTDDKKTLKIIEDFCDRVDRDRIFDSLQSFLAKDYLANVLAISVQIYDKLGRYLIVKRNNKVGISKNFMCVSVTGTVSEEDFNEPDPIKACAIRECLEELSYDIEYDLITVSRIACGQSKIQPAAMVNVLVDDVDDIIDNLKGLPGFEEENQAFYKWSKKDILESLNSLTSRYTEIGTAHLLSIIKE